MKNSLLLIVLSFISVFPVQAEIIRLSGNVNTYELNRSLEYLIDGEGTLGPADAYAKRDEYRPFPKRSVQIPREGVVWLLLELENTGDTSRWILENSMNVELMELFLLKEGEWQLDQKTGNIVPFADRELETRTPAFEISLERDSHRDILIRLSDFQSSSVRLKIEEAEKFAAEYNRRTLLLGIVFGFFAALIIYNLIVYVMNREKVYLIYTLYMAAFFLNQFAQERLFSQFIEPRQPYGFRWFILFGGLTAALGMEFIRWFIGTKRRMPRVDLGLRINRNLLALLVLSGFFYAGPISADILNILSLSAMALIVTALILRIRRRDMLALVCLIGSLVYLAGTASEIIVTLAPIQVSPFVLNAQLYGALTQVLFLGFALGGRTYRLRREYNRMQLRFRDELERQVRDRTRELEEANKKLEEHAVTDPLTGLYNRAELNRRSAELDTYLERKSVENTDYVLTVAYLDLDNFKFYNDTYGHGFGDDLLKRTAGVLEKNTRGYDLIFRVGGDEFLIVMPETGLEEAAGVVERVRDSFEGELSGSTAVSISIGLASSRQLEGAPLEQLIHSADTALLCSKENGKNRISVN